MLSLPLILAINFSTQAIGVPGETQAEEHIDGVEANGQSVY
jgi:hypothetical protein